MSPCRLSLATFKLAVKTSRRDSSSSEQKTHLPLGASSATPQLPIPAKSSVKVKAAVVAVVGVERVDILSRKSQKACRHVVKALALVRGECEHQKVAVRVLVSRQ